MPARNGNNDALAPVLQQFHKESSGDRMKKLGLFVAGSLLVSSAVFAQGKSADAASRAIGFLESKGHKADKVKVKSVSKDELGTEHVKFNEVVDGVPVWGHRLITHELKDGKFDLDGGFRFNGTPLATKASLSADQAINSARVEFGDNNADAIAELVIYPVGGSFRLAYSVDITNTETDSPVFQPRRDQMFIDAHTGMLIDRWANLQTAKPTPVGTPTTGTGLGYYIKNVPALALTVSSGTYRMIDDGSNARTHDLNNQYDPLIGERFGTLISKTSSTFGNNALSDRHSVAVDAHYFAKVTLGYYQSAHGRRGIDNAPATAKPNSGLYHGYMLSRVHLGTNYNNAYWNGRSMAYGDGNGTSYRPFDGLDVVGHEMTHGVTEREAGLVYNRQAGAANEAFSDIFATLVEYVAGPIVHSDNSTRNPDWLIGEDIRISAPGFLRNMGATHTSAGSYTSELGQVVSGDPDHWDERFPQNQGTCDGSNDYCGVHYNSGIMNYAFFMLAQDPGVVTTHHKSLQSVTGIGRTDAGKIAYDALANRITSTNANFAQVAGAMVASAKAYFGTGSTQSVATYASWTAVGITPTVTP
jgi:Zn-dependent metalloprotease